MKGARVSMKELPSGWAWGTPRGSGATRGGSGVLHEVGTFVEYAQPLAGRTRPSCSAGAVPGPACDS